jgi:hypothetical protein
MVVAMVAVGEVQVAIDEVADVVAVRYGLVSASRSVDVAFLMSGTGVIGCAAHGVRRADVDDVLVDVAVVHMMQVPIVDVVDMVAVTDGCVAASRAMDVGVIGMLGVSALAHGWSSVGSGSLRFDYVLKP